MLTLVQVLNLPVLKTATLVAGDKSKNTIVQSISVLEVPKATEFIKQNELLISSFYSILNNIDKQVDLVIDLKRKNVSGLIICHTGIILKKLSKRLIQICDEISLPLVIAAPNTSYYDIISPIMDLLLEKKNSELKKYLEVQNLFMASMSKGKDTKTVLNTLKKVINRNLICIDYQFNCLYKTDFKNSSNTCKNISDNIKFNLNQVLNNHYFYIDLDSKWYITPVLSGSIIYGFLSISCDCEFSEFDKVAISQAKNCLSIVSTLKESMNEFLATVKKDYLVELFFSDFILDHHQIVRGKKLGYYIEKLRQALIIDIFRFNARVATNDESVIANFKKSLLENVTLNISVDKSKYIIFEYSDKLILLFYDDNNLKHPTDILKKIGNYLIYMTKYVFDVEVSVGIGLYYDDYKKIGNSINEAISAIKISNRIFGKPMCTYYKDVFIYDLILKNINSIDASRAIYDLLCKLIQYDLINRTDLLLTLKTLFKYSNNTMDAANSMFVHRNTILQRKRKIIEILKENPFSPENYSKYYLVVLLLDYFNFNLASFNK